MKKNVMLTPLVALVAVFQKSALAGRRFDHARHSEHSMEDGRMNALHTRLLNFVLALTCCAAVSAAHAGERYTLIAGKNNALCQRFGEYLEKATQRDVPPNCETSFGPEFPEFTTIPWREVEPKDHPDLSTQAYRYINDWPWDAETAARLAKRPPGDDARGVELQHRHGWWRMWLAEVDIDNDGRPEKLLRVEDGRCGDRDRTGPRPYDWRVPLMVLNDAQTGIDTVRSEWILGVSIYPPFPPSYIKGIHAIGQDVYDVLQTENRAYLYRWEDDWPIVVGKRYDRRYAGVSVYRIQSGKTERVCRFKLKKLTN